MEERRKRALIVIDMLNDFVLAGAPLEVPETREILPALKRSIADAHRRKIPVIYVCDSHGVKDREFTKLGWPPHAVRGSFGAQVVDSISPKEGDPVVVKKTYSAFYRTSLAKELKERKIEILRLAGCVTHICILFSASDAVLRGFDVEVDERLVAGLTRKSHEFALTEMEEVLGVKVKRRGKV